MSDNSPTKLAFEPCLPVGPRWRSLDRRSVNSFPLSVSIVRMCSGQARSRSRRNRRAVAAVLEFADADKDPAGRTINGYEQVAP